MSFSSYLVGTWERRLSINTTIQIINPTPNELEVFAAFFDDNGNCLECMRLEKLRPNAMWEIPVPKSEEGDEFGVVKVISLKNNEVALGIVGFKRHFLAVPEPHYAIEVAFSESPLAAIADHEYAIAEYRKIEKCKCKTVTRK